jgi:hypothetical protein
MWRSVPRRLWLSRWSGCHLPAASLQNRSFATRRTTKRVLHPDIVNNLPYYDDSVSSEPSGDPFVFPDHPVTSAHCIDVAKQEISMLDSVIVNPTGQVVHGRYGVLGNAAAAVPLEYLALLRPAAEGAAALRVITKSAPAQGGVKKNGTLLIYGASQAAGLAASQMASADGHAVVAVLDGEHSGNDDMCECIKGLLAEPGTAVPEEYALSKQLFRELVHGISRGDEGIAPPAIDQYLIDFKTNFYDYVVAFPDTRPAAVSPEVLQFDSMMEKDREQLDDNMAAFWEQYAPGAPPIEKDKVEANFDKVQYEVFRDKFWWQATDVISGGGEEFFSAAHFVKQQSEAPEPLDNRTYPGAGPYFPYHYSVLNPSFPPGTALPAGGPILGTILVVTKMLQAAVQKVMVPNTTLRQKAEALQFLSRNEKAALGAARVMVQLAQEAKAPVVVIGGDQVLPFERVTATDADVQTALQAMDVDEKGESKLNFFVQVYRANDFPFYGDYAIHRASEPLAGPRQIIVTK